LHQSSRHKLPRKQRLTGSELLQETFKQNHRFVGHLMVMWIRSGNDASLRVGVVAGRTIGNSVERHRAKRRLREAFRLNRHHLQGKCDVVLMARERLIKASWDEVQSELIELAGQAGIVDGKRDRK
jgi:ribonuclease P protein component